MLPIRSTLLPVSATNRQRLEFDSLSRSTLLPIWSTSSPVCTEPKQHGRLSTVLNSALSPVCTWLYGLGKLVTDAMSSSFQTPRESRRRDTRSSLLSSTDDETSTTWHSEVSCYTPPVAERLLRLGLWTLEERRNRCDLIQVFKMFYGYTATEITVLFTFDSNDKRLPGHSKTINTKNLRSFITVKAHCS